MANENRGIASLVEKMDPKRYTTQQVADAVERSYKTVKRWRETGVLEPTEVRTFGTRKVPLYTDADIERGRQIAQGVEPWEATPSAEQPTLFEYKS